jgi:hypothetical protein
MPSPRSKDAPGRGNIASFFRGNWLIIKGSTGKTASHGIGHDFQQATASS